MAPNVREWCEQITILKWFVSRFSSQRQCFNRCFNYNYIFFYRTFDRSSALLERQRSKALRKWKISAGKILWWSLYRNKISNGSWSIWERKLYVLSGNSTSEVTEKRSAHITAPGPVWLNRSSCVYILGCNSYSHLSSPGEGVGKHLISPKLVFITIHGKISFVRNLLFSAW